MADDFSPDAYTFHRRWVDDLVNTPLQQDHVKGSKTSSLTRSPTEHVLRGSKSFAARSWKSRQPINSRVPSNKENRSTTASDSDRPLALPQAFKPVSVLGEIVANNQSIRPIYPNCKSRPSPTPSLRKKKIESLVKAHGSPPHVRVTAGGRIVPSDQSPLCHPRYGYSAIQVNGGLIKFAPNHPVGKAQWTEATQNGFVAQDIHGRLCQIVGKEFRPLEEINGALRLFIPAPNIRIADPEATSGPASGDIAASTTSEEHRQMSRVVALEPPPSAQINALQLEYSKLNIELKDVDKTEVLHGRTMGKAAKDALIGKRRELVTALDKIRRAIKSLEQQTVTATAPSPPPKGAAAKNPASPQKNRLPPFLQQRHVLQQTQVAQAPSGVYAPFFGPTQPQAFPPPFGFQTTPSPTLSSLNTVYTPSTNAESAFNPQWGIQSAPMFVPPPPPPFDGSMSSASLPYLQGNLQGTSTYCQPAQQFATNHEMAQCNDVTLPQHDGSHCCADLQRVASPRQSHALPIKAPEQKTLKSSLNPMSPVYKPNKSATAEGNKDENHHKAAQPTQKLTQAPSSPSQPLDSPVQDSTYGDNGKSPRSSPLRKPTLVQSSSISSFATADFFPSNTREYSTRKDEYPEGLVPSVGKENATPLPRDLTNSNAVTPPKQAPFPHGHPVIVNGSTDPASPQTGGYKAPAPPPGTPVQQSATISNDRLPLRINGSSWERQSHGFDVDTVPDRHAHNISPKVKRRDWLFVEEDPAQEAGQPSSSPEKFYQCRDEICVQSSPCFDADFLKKPRDFVEGYKAGIDRHPPSFDRSSDWLEGYCTALMKSKSQSSGSAIALPSNGSPTRSASRRPSPVPIQQHSLRGPDIERRNAVFSRPSLATVETALHSLDSLKQAVFAPQNENAVLTPAVDGPHVSEAPMNLGAWARHQDKIVSMQAQPVHQADSFASFHFPSRTASIIKRQAANPDDCVGPKDERMGLYRGDNGSNGSGVPLLQVERSGNEFAQSSRMSSFSSKSAGCGSDSSAEVRLSSMTSIDSNLYRNWPGHRIFSPHLEYKSISSVAQHAGLASGYFAQGHHDGTNDELHPPAAPTLTHASVIGAPQTQRLASNAGDCAAPQTRHSKEASLDGMSSPPKSPPPPQSPPGSPRGSPEKGKPRESPGKGSPARVKFEHIAEKVGIKVNNTKDTKETAESSTPPGKRRWHNVWKGFGNGKDIGKDENAAAGSKQSSRT